MSPLEASSKPALPRRFHRPRVVVLAYVPDRVGAAQGNFRAVLLAPVRSAKPGYVDAARRRDQTSRRILSGCRSEADRNRPTHRPSDEITLIGKLRGGESDEILKPSDVRIVWLSAGDPGEGSLSNRKPK